MYKISEKKVDCILINKSISESLQVSENGLRNSEYNTYHLFLDRERFHSLQKYKFIRTKYTLKVSNNNGEEHVFQGTGELVNFRTTTKYFLCDLLIYNQRLT